MVTQRYPVLVWRDAAGFFTAALVGEFETAAGYAATELEAMRQLKELLEWRVEHEPWRAEPDISDPELIEVKIEIRPQYEIGKRVVPCAETIWLRTPCVTGVQENGMRLCVVPHLSVEFEYHDPGSAKSLAAHYVKENLHGLSPMQLAQKLPPQGCKLEEIVVRHSGARVKQVAPADRSEFKILFSAADPLLHDRGSARAASAAYGREAFADSLATKLRLEKTNVLLVGEAGVGKSTLLLDAARRFVRASKPGAAHGMRSYCFWRTSGGRLIAGMRYLGEWEERCESFIGQLGNIEGFFCAENLLELLQVGGQSPGESVGAFLLPYLQRGELRMIAEATPAELEACRRLLPGLADVFQPMHVPEFKDEEALEVLTRVAHAHASASRVEVEGNAILLTQRLFKRFQPYRAFPGPAANFVRTLIEQRGKETALGVGAVVTHFVRETGLPEVLLRDEFPLSLESVAAQMAAKIVGQTKATRAAAQVVTTIKAGLTDPLRPYGVLLFCGPTGVGKTALANTLAEFCFGAGARKHRLIRLDMSEYSGWGATRRFLQSADGQPAAWIERVRQEPFCVLLFDEIEKAAPDVFDTLLGLLDEGRMTDRFGRTTWFRSAIVIMTSNIGATTSGAIGFGDDPGASYEGEVAKFFRPEFVNRLDAVIAFKSLTRENVEEIAQKELKELAAREGFAVNGLKLEWTSEVVALLAREGYDHRFGARPLQRALERLVATPLARWLVKNSRSQGNTILLELNAEGKIVIPM